MNVLSLFDGISCGQVALKRAGITVDKYYASEIDKYAISITQKQFPDTIQIGDITKIKIQNDFSPRIDLLLGGPPCQDLSCLHRGAGLCGEKSKLFWEYVRLKHELRPRWFLLENVVPRKKEWIENISANIGVNPFFINSDLFVPQNRPRLYWTNIPVGLLPARKRWSFEYYQYRRTYFRQNQSGVCPCLTANMGTGGHNVPLKSENLKDKLTPEECEELQGLKPGYTSGISNSQRYKEIGRAHV